MKVYLIHKYESDDEKYKSEFVSFCTSEKLASFATKLYYNMHVHEIEMSEISYENFYNMHKAKDLIVVKNKSHIGYIIMRRCDIYELISKGIKFYDSTESRARFCGE